MVGKMIDLILWPLRLAGGIIEACMGIISGALHLAFGLVGGVLSLTAGFLCLGLGIAVIVMIWRILEALLRAA